jgi:hypothetical protein
MKAISFENPSQALAAAIWMESFFDSESVTHRELSRHVAASLLPRVENVAGFDNVLTDLVAHPDVANQKDIINIAQGISNFQWQRYGTPPEDPIARRSATREAIGGLEGPRKVRGHEVDFAAFSAGTWEIETASHALWQIWVEKKVASPRGMNLGDVVLENTRFEPPGGSSTKFYTMGCFSTVKSPRFVHGRLLRRLRTRREARRGSELDQSAQVSLLWSKPNSRDAWMSAASIGCRPRMSSGTPFAQTTDAEGGFRRNKPSAL